MGFDAVELVMTVEEAFGLKIPDAQAEKIRTVGDLKHWVLARLNVVEDETSRCLSAATFYGFRRGLVDQFGLDRRCVRLDSGLESLIPQANRKSEWQRLGERMGWKLPALVCPTWVGRTFFILTLAWLVTTAIVCGWAAIISGIVGLMAPLFGLSMGYALLYVVFYKLTNPLAIHFQSQTLRGMIPLILGLNLSAIRDGQPVWTRSDVWETLVAIIYLSGAAPQKITESTRFVEDLGIED
jgi:hypothetical protein